MENEICLKKLNNQILEKRIMAKKEEKQVKKTKKDDPNLARSAFIISIISTSILVLTFIWSIFKDIYIQTVGYYNMKTEIYAKMDNIDEKFEDMEEDIKNINEQIYTIISTQAILIEPSDSFKQVLASTYESESSVYNTEDNILWEDLSTIVGTDKVKGKPYTVEDLANEMVVLSYVDETGATVYFKGEFNEKGCWNNNCIINQYLDGKLMMIMDATYDNGKLVSYKQVKNTDIVTNNEKLNIWLVSARKVVDDSNEGETWTYYKKEDVLCDFDSENLAYNDIMSQNDFLTKFDLVKESYYCGNTSNDKYNDETGKAYIVKYNEEGFVRYLYEGKFIDGEPCDMTGNAWSIALGYDGKNYYYYKGVIQNGQRSRKLTDDDIVSLDKIQEILADKEFNCELNWLSVE